MTEKNKKLNIALMINYVANDYSYSVCRGAAIAAQEYDINLLIVPGGEINKQQNDLYEFQYQNNVIYSYITKNNIDVLIISLGTVAGFMDSRQTIEFLDSFKGIKVIVLEMEVQGYPSITYDLNGFEESVRHLIEYHHKKRIGYVGGPRDQQVAQKRLEAYKKVLCECGIEFDENLVVYSDFSDKADTVVRELLDKNKSDPPDAVCFANDTMALAGYKVFEQRGIKIGRDIAVTGFDDVSFADVINPPLTTVKSAIMSIGYKSVEAAVRYIQEDKIDNITINTYFMCRQSCGCPETDYYTRFKPEPADISMSASDLAERVRKYIIEKSSLDIISRSQLIRLKSFIIVMIENLVCKQDFEVKELIRIIERFLSNNDMIYYNLDSLNELIYILKEISLNLADKDKQIKIYKVFERFYDYINDFYAGKLFSAERENAQYQLVYSKVANDMMANGKDEKKCFSLIMDDICNMKMKSCYIYVYEQSFLNQKVTQTKQTWKRPGKIFLKAFKNGEIYQIPQASQQAVDSEAFMENMFTPNNRTKTMILKALFFNEEQYGILLAETTVNGMLDIETASQQLCTAIKMTRFMNLIESALVNVQQANAILSKESVSDQLTGLYNRRGLIIESEKLLKQYTDRSCRCAVIFADLDSLKIINDTFGHDEGDFAIKKASEILKINMRSSDIVGRIGGDEFVAFVMEAEEKCLYSVIDRIKKCADEFNQSSQKPYNVELSLGVYCFNSYDGETADNLMSKADHILYENKQHKKSTPIKDLLKKR
ncbi:MAG: GGDEF domain-containing protein [Oscillospiraceae bacterium]|nr:GGDEF domain-containing protein [Oscillospiraceae bacterium]